MADETYIIPDNPVYSTKIRKIQDRDPVTASTIVNPVIEQLIENTEAVKIRADEAYELADGGAESMDGTPLIYVDPNTTNTTQNGSNRYPFQKISQALDLLKTLDPSDGSGDAVLIIQPGVCEEDEGNVQIHDTNGFNVTFFSYSARGAAGVKIPALAIAESSGSTLGDLFFKGVDVYDDSLDMHGNIEAKTNGKIVFEDCIFSKHMTISTANTASVNFESCVFNGRLTLGSKGTVALRNCTASSTEYVGIAGGITYLVGCDNVFLIHAAGTVIVDGTRFRAQDYLSRINVSIHSIAQGRDNMLILYSGSTLQPDHSGMDLNFGKVVMTSANSFYMKAAFQSDPLHDELNGTRIHTSADVGEVTALPSASAYLGNENVGDDNWYKMMDGTLGSASNFMASFLITRTDCMTAAGSRLAWTGVATLNVRVNSPEDEPVCKFVIQSIDQSGAYGDYDMVVTVTDNGDSTMTWALWCNTYVADTGWRIDFLRPANTLSSVTTTEPNTYTHTGVGQGYPPEGKWWFRPELAVKASSSDASQVYDETSSNATVRTVTVPGITSYSDLTGKVITINPTTATGTQWASVTLNVNGLGSVPIHVPNVTNPAAANANLPYAIKIGVPYMVFYNGLVFVLLNPGFTTGSGNSAGLLRNNDTVTSTLTAGYAATPNAVKTAYDLAANANTNAYTALQRANLAYNAANTANATAINATSRANLAYNQANVAANVVVNMNPVKIGLNAVATGVNSIAIGTDSNVSNNTASIAIGARSSATMTQAIAIGYAAVTNGSSGIAMGYGSRGLSNYSAAIGTQAKAGTSYAVGLYAAAFGYNANAPGLYGLALGGNAYALGGNTVAIGAIARAIFENSVAVGPLANANGGGAVAVGSEAYSAGVNAIAIGTKAQANTVESTAIGKSSIATGVSATAYGSNSSSTGSAALALGVFSNAGAENTIAIGFNATASNSSAISIGNSARSNRSYSIAIGQRAIVSNTNAIAIGTQSNALGTNTIAIGLNAYADASGNSVVIGYNATAYNTAGQHGSSGSIVLGFNAVSAAQGAMAIGPQSNAAGAGAIAIGSAAVTATNSQVYWTQSMTSFSAPVQYTNRSDERDKTNIESIDKAIEFLNELDAITYQDNKRESYIMDAGESNHKIDGKPYDAEEHAKATKKHSRRNVGFKAQDIQAAMQKIYGTDDYANIVYDNQYDWDDEKKAEWGENKLTVAYSALVPFLVEAVKTLSAEIKALKAERNENGGN